MTRASPKVSRTWRWPTIRRRRPPLPSRYSSVRWTFASASLAATRPLVATSLADLGMFYIYTQARYDDAEPSNTY